MEGLNFSKGFKYPFNRAKGMLNIFWILVPIYGWFVLYGYLVRIVKEFIDGKFDELPENKASENFSYGFNMFFKSVPLAIVIGTFGWFVNFVSGEFTFVSKIVSFLVSLFVTIPLLINFYDKETVASSFDFKILKNIFSNLGEFLLTFLKATGLTIIFAAMSVILVGIPLFIIHSLDILCRFL